jgi:hypothetical protein
MVDSINNSLDAHPADSLCSAILKITRSTPEKAEGERLMSALFAYFREPPDSKITAAENKVTALKYSIERLECEVRALNIKNEAQAKLLKENGIRVEMNNLYHKLCDVMGRTQ